MSVTERDAGMGARVRTPRGRVATLISVNGARAKIRYPTGAFVWFPANQLELLGREEVALDATEVVAIETMLIWARASGDLPLEVVKAVAVLQRAIGRSVPEEETA